MFDISASVIQRSIVVPISDVVSAADLSTFTAGNSVYKYDDT